MPFTFYKTVDTGYKYIDQKNLDIIPSELFIKLEKTFEKDATETVL